ncbi:MAG: putative bifunctional diguanylate cyclase/phosphodiesterase [Nitrospiria bacterium]
MKLSNPTQNQSKVARTGDPVADETIPADILEMAHVAYWRSDLLTRNQFWSDALYQLLGARPEETDPSEELILNTIHPEDRAVVQSAHNKAIAENKPYEITFRIIRKHGEPSLVRARGKICLDENGHPAELVETLQVIDEHQYTEKSFAHRAYLDPLTGLPNRQGFYDRLDKTIQRAKREKSNFALLYIDLDDFKNVNETKGHAAGDRLLQEMAGRMRECARSGDPLSRLSGDEFTLVLEKLPHEKGAASAAKRIIDTLSKPFHYQGKEIDSTVSIGISVYPENGTTAEDLLQNADAAMSHAKKTGKNAFRFFTKALNEKIHRQAKLEAALRKSMDTWELEAYFQPIVSLKNRSIVSMEALIRWPQTDGGFISPGEFIPLAEEKGLISDIDQFMIRTVCDFVRKMKTKTADGRAQTPHASVNLSAVDFDRVDLCRQLTKTIQDFGLSPHDIGLELTESTVIKNIALAIEHLNRLRDQGFRISMDDFGTGYSSLSYLAKLPIDVLKIDGSFVVDLPRNPRNNAIAKAIVFMAHEMGIEVVAEGVETRAQLDFLDAIGCDNIQGYIFSPALPGPQMAHLLGQAQPFAKKSAAFSAASL